MVAGDDAPEKLLARTSAALIVLDAQNRYFWTREDGEELPAVAILPRIARLIEASRKSGRCCIFAHVPGDRDADAPSWSRHRTHLSLQMGGRLDESLWGRSLVASVSPHPGDIVVSKLRLSAFYGTPLEIYLRAWRIETVVLAGVATNGAVLATALDAVSRDLYSLVVLDATAGTTAEHHTAALTVLGSENLISSDAVCDAWLGGADAL